MRSTLRRAWFRLAILTFVGVALGSCGKAREPRTLLLISVDTLRADRIGVYGGPAGLTPHLEELARGSIVFDAAYAPCSFTLPSVATIFTGRYPEENGILSNEYEIPAQVSTLATQLKAAGFATGAVVSNFVLRRTSRLDRGFDHYDDEFPQIEQVRELPERIASFTTDAALSMLDLLRAAEPEHVFLWVHYQDPHGPYAPPEALHREWSAREADTADAARELPAGRDNRGIGSIPAYQRVGPERSVGFYRAGYHAEIRFVDEGIGRLLRGFEDRGALEGGVVVFVADHGEGLGEEDYWFAHGEHLTDNLTRVPLFVRLPSGRTGMRRDVVSLADLYPTLLELMVPGRVPPSRVGRDLFAPGARERNSTVYLASLEGSSVPRFGVILDGYKYIFSPAASPRERLHRLGDEARDLTRVEPSVLDAMRRQLAIEQKSLSRVVPAPQQPSPQDLERLRSLGYVPASSPPPLPNPD